MLQCLRCGFIGGEESFDGQLRQSDVEWCTENGCGAEER
jgi:hypothetical protein